MIHGVPGAAIPLYLQRKRKSLRRKARERDFGALSFCNFELDRVETGSGLYVQMVFESGASTTTFPPDIGEGHDFLKDEYVGRKYHGAGTEVIKDEGWRAINVLDENWNAKSMKHRVADLRNPLVAASQTVHA